MPRRRVILISIALLALFFLLLIRFSPYTDLKHFEKRGWSTTVYDAQNNLLQVLPLDQGLRMEYTPLEAIPDLLVEKVIQAEDKKFYYHCGIDFSAIIRALWQNIKSGKKVSGASTITMQLTRIISTPRPRTIASKITEAYNALRLETRLSKDRILELYLNSVPFGFQTAGFTSASRYFYGTSLENLDEKKIQELILIPRNPVLYNPLKNGNNYAYTYPFLLPHLIEYVKPQIKGKTTVRLSVDYHLTKTTQYLLRSAIEENSSTRLANGACIAIENATGNILVWANSSEWNDQSTLGAIDGCLIKIQPGSSMKPFLYALALEKNYTPASIIADTPQRFGGYEIYMPQNFNNQYNGPVRLRVALASSLNVPAVLLLNDIELPPYLNTLDQLGFISLRNTGLDYGLSLALGSGEVTLAELTRAFSVFPNDGILRPLHYIVSSSNTSAPEAFKTQSQTRTNQTDSPAIQVFENDTARIICSILSDTDARELGFGRPHTFMTEFDSIFKTGTSNQYQNITALAASPDYTVGVWMGNFKGNTIIGKTGSSIPAQVAKRLLTELQKNTPLSSSFLIPDKYVLCNICPLSGMKTSIDCPASIKEYIPDIYADSLPTCSWHQDNTILYPAEYQEWFFEQERKGTLSYNSDVLKIRQPSNNNIFIFQNNLHTQQVIPLQVTGGLANTLKIFYNGTIYATINRPFQIDLPLKPGRHEISVQCADETDSITYTVE
ncbi:MAG TPA: transglycosylase domain-containing protein [Treponemataceae bacterium]|nr:transglycosylase domain-containing protein [Treponemataceae bacterium]